MHPVCGEFSTATFQHSPCSDIPTALEVAARRPGYIPSTQTDSAVGKIFGEIYALKAGNSMWKL